MFEDIGFVMLLPYNKKALNYQKTKNKNKSWIIEIGQIKIKKKH